MLESHRDVGKSVGLTGDMLDIFERYMHERWPNSEFGHVKHGYSKEWAIRFRDRVAYSSSDSIGQGILKSWGYKD